MKKPFLEIIALLASSVVLGAVVSVVLTGLVMILGHESTSVFDRESWMEPTLLPKAVQAFLVVWVLMGASSFVTGLVWYAFTGSRTSFTSSRTVPLTVPESDDALMASLFRALGWGIVWVVMTLVAARIAGADGYGLALMVMWGMFLGIIPVLALTFTPLLLWSWRRSITWVRARA